MIFDKLCEYENSNERVEMIKYFDFLQSKMISGITFSTGVGMLLQRNKELRFTLNFNSLENLRDFLIEIRNIDYGGTTQLIDLLKLLTEKEIGRLCLTLSSLGILDTVGVEVYPRDWKMVLELLKKRNLCKDYYIDKFNLWYQKGTKSFINKISHVKLVYSNSDGLYAKVYFGLIEI